MEKLSNAQQIKELYKQRLADCQIHSRIDLFTYAKSHSGNMFTDGMLTGALRTLVTDTDDYVCVSRGRYKKKSPSESMEESNTLIDAYAEILKDALNKSRHITSDPFKVMKMTAKDIEKMTDIENCIDIISKTLEKIR